MPDSKPTEKKVDPDKVVAAEQDKGYRGVAVDPNPNEAYSTQTGPDSPVSTGRLVQHDIGDLTGDEV